MKKLLIALSLALFLFSCDDGGGEKESGENGKEIYYTVTYHKNANYNKVFLGMDIIGEITGEPPVDPTLYKSGDRLNGQNKPYGGSTVFEGLGQGTMELEGYRFIGWVRRLADVDDGSPFYGMENYTDDNPIWFPGPPPRAGWVFYHHNVDLDPIWEKLYPY